jgi:hypothetical protein
MSQDGSTHLAMIALKSAKIPGSSDIIAEFEKRCPDGPKLTATDKQDTTCMFDLGGRTAFVSLMPAPIPWSDLEGPCATAWWWPEAADCLQNHRYHAIVGFMGEDDDLVRNHIWLSQLVSAAAVISDAAGIYWGSGTVVHEPQAFADTTAELEPDDVNPSLWIDMRLEQNEDESYRFFTTGLSAFGQPEMEIDRSERPPEDILNFCFDIIAYLLNSRVTIGNGETVGRSADEKVRVTYAPSMWERAGDVMKLALD